jgi:hypothetical protein
MNRYNNEYLFTQAYLSQLLEQPADAKRLSPLLDTLRDWWEVADLSAFEGGLDFVNNVLDSLEFFHVPAANDGHTQLLYADLTREKTLGVCYTVAPDADLNCTHKGAHSAEKVIRALRTHGLGWGILTNGRLWRLYRRDGTTPYETYLEVNLEETLKTQDWVAFRFFDQFFSKSAFIPDENGQTALDVHRRESEAATDVLEKHLKSKVEEVLGRICYGFVEVEGKVQFTDSERQEIFHNSVYLLYRILFLLYAESRGLLPLDNPEYYEKSITHLTELALQKHQGTTIGKDPLEMWKNLRTLCEWIDTGYDDLGIATYDGGLFDNKEKPYLTAYVIQDAYLSEALYYLTYYERAKGKDSPFPPFPFSPSSSKIDYRDLSVRHLGSLYEGILEYKLFIAEERMVGRQENKTIRFIPVSETTPKKGERIYEVGEVYFAQSKGERKASGSYYTPEYIVAYIVDHTVGTGLQKRRESFYERIAKDREALTVALNERERVSVQHLLDKYVLDFICKEVLSFRVLDPAMGSGHFLVNALNLITNFIVETLNEFAWENNDPNLDSNPTRWRRLVVERCLFGVDINPLATELAKLSLWISSTSKDKPLSFLDHHLRDGNSLIGARIADLGRLPQRKAKKHRGKDAEEDNDTPGSDLFEHAFENEREELVKAFVELESLPSERREDIDEKKRQLKKIQRRIERFHVIVNLWTASFFDATIHQGVYQSALSCLTLDEHKWNVLEITDWFRKAQRFANEKRFFHWELEFPEVFFGTGNSSGFDAVVGNPPYISFYSRQAMKPTEEEVEFLSSRFTHEVGGRINTFLLFIGQAVWMIKRGGAFSFIVPDTFTNNETYAYTRRFLLERCHLTRVDRLDFPVFDDPTVRTCILVVWKDISAPTTLCLSRKLDSFVKGEHEVTLTITWEDIASIDDTRLLFLPQSWFTTVNKIRHSGIRLETICEVGDGINPGPKSFRDLIVNPSPPIKPTWRKLIEGEDIDRYEVFYRNKIIDYDLSFSTKLRREQGVRLRAEWKFDFPKLISKQTADRLVFAYDNAQAYHLNSVHSTLIRPDVPYSLLFILSILNSSLMNWFYKVYFQETRDVFPQVHISSLDKLPIRCITFVTPTDERIQLLDKSKQFYERYLSKEDNGYILEFVEHQLAQTPERTDIIHDLLAYLAEQMIAMNREKQRLCKEFFSFLKGLGVDKDVLKPKAQLDKLWELEASEVLAHLKKNKVALTAAEFAEVEAQAIATLGQLKPLLVRIQRTGNFIDQIVYRLYGLTEEEIKIVEDSLR